MPAGNLQPNLDKNGSLLPHQTLTIQVALMAQMALLAHLRQKSEVSNGRSPYANSTLELDTHRRMDYGRITFCKYAPIEAKAVYTYQEIYRKLR